MSSIVTITLNPAIDKSTTVPVLVPEKKMRCTPPVFEPGGGGINVARAIKKLGGNATAVYFAGGYTGRFFTALLANEGVESLIIETTKHTRENLIVMDNASNQQYRFGMPGPLIEAKEWQEMLRVIEKIHDAAFIIASGSVPAGVPLDIFGRIAVIAKKNKAKFIVDTSGEALRQAASEGVYLLKPNLSELSSLIGVEEISTNRIDQLAKQIITKGNCEVVLVSMGAAGAMLVTNERAEQINAPVVKRKSTVGAGDSMVAGMVLGLQKNMPIIAAAKYGVACGTAATMNAGTELCRKADADKLFAQL
jgi:6-phosphofructokinase 2